MTREERQYFYKQLKKMFEEWLITTTQTNVVYSDLTSFAEKYMQTITGQQFLPQDVFRVFLSEYVPIVVGGLEGKQDKYDEGLKTADKTVVGAINEVKQKALDDYGPYENTTLEAVATMLHDRLTLGKTIGVIEDGYVVEYWWQPKDEGIKFISKNGNEIKCERDHEQDRDGYIAWVHYNRYGFPEYYYTKEDSPEVFMYRQVIGDFPITADSYETIIIYGFVKKAAGEGGGGNNPIKPLPSIAIDTELDKDSSNAIANKAVAEKFEEIEGLIGTGGGSVTIEQDIKTNVACGALPAGSTIDAGKTFTEVIRLLTSKVLLASRHTSPSATIQSTISTNTTKEVGETIAPTLTAKFNDGKFNSYTAGAIVTETIDAGCTATAYQILRGSTVVSNSASYTDSYKLPSGNTTYTCKITHSASASDIPTNSDGSVNTSEQFSSSTVTSNSITIKGAYKYFYGSANSLPTDVRSLTNNFNRPSLVNMSGTKWFLYVPKTSTQPTSFKTALETYTIENEIFSNKDKKGVILKKEVTVKDAGGSDVAYYRYMMQLDNALGSNINIA